MARIETQLRLRDGWMAEIEAVRSNQLLDQASETLIVTTPIPPVSRLDLAQANGCGQVRKFICYFIRLRMKWKE